MTQPAIVESMLKVTEIKKRLRNRKRFETNIFKAMATISYGLKPLNSFICTSKAKGSCDLSLSTIYHKATKMTTNIDKSKKKIQLI